jgi:hypothetical protein
MVQQTLNPPRNRTEPFNTGDSAERGDTPSDLVAKLTAMLTELYNKTLAGSIYNTNASVGATTAAQGDLTGGLTVVCNYSAVSANNLTTRTAAQMIADANMVVGQSYEVEIINTSGGTMSVVGGAGVTVNGTVTIGAGNARWFSVKVTGAATITMQNLGFGTFN